MTDSYTSEHDLRSAHSRQSEARGLEGDLAHSLDADVQYPFSTTLLGERGLGEHGNAPVRAASMNFAQQTFGNRAVQRFLQRSVGITGALDTMATIGEYANVPAWPAMISQHVNELAMQQVAQNPDGGIVDIASGMLDAERQRGRAAGATVHQAEGLFGQGVEWLEGQQSGAAHWLADQAQGVPLLGTAANAGANMVDNYLQMGTGMLKGAGGLVSGLAGMVANPVDAAIGLGTLAEHVPMPIPGVPNPLKVGHGIYDVVANDAPLLDTANRVLNPIASQQEDSQFFMGMGQNMLKPYGEAWERGRYGEIAGRAAFDVGSFFVGGGEARGAAEAGSVVRGIEGAEAAAAAVRGMEGAEAASAAVRGVEGAEAARLAEGLEGARGVASKPEHLAYSPKAPVRTAFDEVTQKLDIHDMPTALEEVTQRIDIHDMPTALGDVTQQIDIGDISTMTDEIAEATSKAPLEAPAPIDFGPIQAPTSTPAASAAGPASELDVFKQITQGDTKLANAPKELTLPKELKEGMDKAWKESLPGGVSQEQGGIMVQRPDGSLGWKQGPPGKSGSYSPNYKDVAPGERLAGTGHTHPYDVNEGGLEDVSFSGGDMSRMVYADDPMQIVKSGESEFVTARTEEFNSRVKGLDNAGKAGMAKDMESTWQSVFDTMQDAGMSIQDSVEAAVNIVHSKFDLLYYKGKDGLLSRQ